MNVADLFMYRCKFRRIGMSIGLALTMGAASGAAASTCNDLEISLIPDEWEIDAKATACEHGKVVRGNSQRLVIGSVDYSPYGPTCNLFFRGPDSAYAMVKFDQIICIATAGQITVTPVKGSKLTYSKTEGSRLTNSPARSAF